jgi:ribosomal protein S18 acetylase RimI-like enzyme
MPFVLNGIFLSLVLRCLAAGELDGSIRAVEYYRDIQSIKTYEQIVDDYAVVFKEFHGEDPHPSVTVENLKCSDIFELRKGRKMVGFISFVTENYLTEARALFGLGPLRIIKKPCAAMYSLYVSEEYRRKGYARKIIKMSTKALKRHYGLGDDFVLLLHLNPRDRFMEEAFCLYHSLNFRRGAYSMNDPESHKYRLDDIYGFRDALEIIDNPELCSESGRYLLLACRYSEVGKGAGSRLSTDEARRYAKRLRTILENNRDKYNKSR